MRFLVDAQLPPALARWLTAQGHEAQMTKDEDFVGLREQKADGPVVVWLRIGNATNPALIDWIAKVWPDVETAITAGETVIEVR